MKYTLRIDWKIGLMGLVLVYFTGPLPLVAYSIQRWAVASRWDWRDRWASVRAFSVIFGLFYLVCLVFLLLLLPPFAAQEHMIAPIFQHVSTLVASSIFPPGIQNILVRWMFAQLMAPALALFMERRDPRSGPYSYTRVELPGEIPEPEPKRRRTASTTTKKKQKTVSATTVTLQAQPMSQKTAVIQDDSVKQQVMEEDLDQKGMHTLTIELPQETAPAQVPTSPPPTENEPPAQEQKPKKRIDFSKVKE